MAKWATNSFKKGKTIYANVCECQDGNEYMTSFGDDLVKMIKEAEDTKLGVTMILSATVSDTPAWVRQ